MSMLRVVPEALKVPACADPIRANPKPKSQPARARDPAIQANPNDEKSGIVICNVALFENNNFGDRN